MSHTPCVFTDSDWAGCTRTRESTSGRVLMMQGGAVMWQSERQRSIALSSAEAELVALSESCRDARFIRCLHASIGSAIPNPTPAYVDNNSALTWAHHKAKWSASRHIATRYFCVRDWKKAGQVLPLRVDTTRQLADMFTKALPHASFTYTCAAW